MPKYEVEIQFEGMLFTVEANSEEEAKEKAFEMFYIESGGPSFYSVEALLVEDDDA